MVNCPVFQWTLCWIKFIPDDIRAAILEAGVVAKVVKLLNHPSNDVCEIAVRVLAELTQYGNLLCLSIDQLFHLFGLDGFQATIIEAVAARRVIALLNHPIDSVYHSAALAITKLADLTHYGNL
jgi:hypothetical protein